MSSLDHVDWDMFQSCLDYINQFANVVISFSMFAATTVTTSSENPNTDSSPTVSAHKAASHRVQCIVEDAVSRLIVYFITGSIPSSIDPLHFTCHSKSPILHTTLSHVESIGII